MTGTYKHALNIQAALTTKITMNVGMYGIKETDKNAGAEYHRKNIHADLLVNISVSLLKFSRFIYI